MYAGGILASHILPGSAAGWDIAGTGDFSGDGKEDILFRRSDGTVATWHLNGGAVTSTHTFSLAPTDWHLVGREYDYLYGATAAPTGTEAP